MKNEDVKKCRSCGKDIVWMKTTRGKNMPVDMSEKVRLFLDFTKPRPLIFNSKTMISHFATCPDAEEHRKGIKK